MSAPVERALRDVTLFPLWLDNPAAPTPERGGRAKRYFALQPAGAYALTRSALLEGREPALEGVHDQGLRADPNQEVPGEVHAGRVEAEPGGHLDVHDALVAFLAGVDRQVDALGQRGDSEGGQRHQQESRHAAPTNGVSAGVSYARR